VTRAPDIDRALRAGELAWVELGFLTPREVAHWRTIADSSPAWNWSAGRQGTGYHKLDLRQQFSEAPLAALRCLELIRARPSDPWDCYLIRYWETSWAPRHKDPAEPGRRHARVNVLLRKGASGGDLEVAGARVPLSVGDAVLFYPDAAEHQVSQVFGERLALSVGALVDP
jgi:hypothetical protein